MTTRLTQTVLDLDSSYLEAAKAMLATLTRRVGTSPNYVPLTKEQIETYLEFDPTFADEARKLLREFIKKQEKK
jgi:hypothetical protein